MDFSLNEEVTSVQQLAQQILSDFTEVEKLKAADEQGERFDSALWAALAEAGLLGLDTEEAHGGTDLGFFSVMTLCEEVGRTVAPVPVISVLVSAAGTLRRFGTEAQKEQWLSAIANGDAQVAATCSLAHLYAEQGEADRAIALYEGALRTAAARRRERQRRLTPRPGAREGRALRFSAGRSGSSRSR